MAVSKDGPQYRFVIPGTRIIRWQLGPQNLFGGPVPMRFAIASAFWRPRSGRLEGWAAIPICDSRY